ncbi:Thioredoxin-like protein 1 [Halotydeus destructor]|nr:Thioredoxin-like protein 1 [Halotydeus destructor]
MPITVVQEDSQFQTELTSAGSSLVVVDFTASWCGPCQRIAPVFEQLSNRYASNTKFLKVDVDQCPNAAASQNVSAMPTFMFFRSGVKLATMQGADPTALENKVRELAAQVPEGAAGSEGSSEQFDGHVDLVGMIFKSGCECLNESDDHPLSGALQAGSATYLESDCDEQLIISLAYSQPVKLHSIKLEGPAENGPKEVKLFINQPKTIDFDQADSMECTQSFELTSNDLTSKVPLNLRFVKFQNVSNLIIFVKNNQNGSDVTRLDHLQIIGSPLAKTNMEDFKRVAGKKGESH